MFLKAVRRWWGRPRDPSGHVYYVKLRTPQGAFYKLGYTSKASLKERMAYGGYGDEKLIDREFFFTFRKDAWDVEQKLRDHFEGQCAFGRYGNDAAMPLAGRGQSELFRHDVLGLDEDCYKPPEGELLKVIQAEQDQAKDGCFMVLIGLALAPFTLGFSLLFIAGGASGIFGYGKGRPRVPTRPVHPHAVQQLIDALKRISSPT